LIEADLNLSPERNALVVVVWRKREGHGNTNFLREQEAASDFQLSIRQPISFFTGDSCALACDT
jgi:hypothetical protein